MIIEQENKTRKKIEKKKIASNEHVNHFITILLFFFSDQFQQLNILQINICEIDDITV